MTVEITATATERYQAQDRAARFGPPETLPFSFTCDGQAAEDLLPDWTFAETVLPLADGATTRVLTWTDPVSGLECVLELVTYADFPVVEWVVRVRNGGSAPTPLLADLWGLRVSLGTSESTLHHHKGDTCGRDAYQPQALVLEKSTRYEFAPAGGRPTSMAWPCFNVEQDKSGVIVALGWPGQWQAVFERDGDGSLSVRGGQERTRFRLTPGEEARTPRSVLLFWEGDRRRAQNLWRRWMRAHNLPRVAGEGPAPMTSQCSGNWQSETNETALVDALADNQAPMDYWWVDAGWWKEGFPVGGNWEPDAERFPHGLRPLSDRVHARGMKLVLWFEPERVSPGTPWADRAEWLLTLPPEARRERGEIHFNGEKFTRDEAARNQMIIGDRLFNLGNADARAFLADFLAARISEWDIDFLRIDFNISPLAYWQEADGEDRQGLTENHYVTGWLALLDDLRSRFPTLWIDTCASGGRRMDLETLRRAVPLLRSDYQFEPVGNQGHTYGLSSWVPYYGTGVYYNAPYEFRSSLAPATGLGYRPGSGEPDWPLFRRRLAEAREVSPLMLGDFYPLMGYSLNADTWMAWQFNRADIGAGVVQAFRRSDSPFETARLKLDGLDRDAVYEIRQVGQEETQSCSGSVLMDEGLSIAFEQAPQALSIVYYRTDASFSK